MKWFFFVSLTITLFFYGSFFYLRQQLRYYLHTHPFSETNVLTADFSPSTEYVITSDSKKIAYWYVPAKNPKAVVILVHGYHNPGGKGQMVGHARYLREAGYSTVLVDLRSFGESEGDRVKLGTQEWQDLESVYLAIRQRPENKGKKIGFLGVSMGAVSALNTAAKTGKGDFVIASVPYADVRSLQTTQLQQRGLPPAVFLYFLDQATVQELGAQYNAVSPLQLVSQIKVPVLFIGATKDDVVNPQDAQRLYQLANQPKEYWEVESRHDVFYFHSHEFSEKVLWFLEKYTQ
jgi:alpha-beta hydrolase superfamily lysophospholipase